MIKTTKKLKNSSPKTEVAKPENGQPVTAKPATTKAAVIEPITAPKPVVAATPAPVKPVAPPTPANKPQLKNVVSLELVKPEAKSVAVAGSFNEWKPERTPLVPLGNGQWKGNLDVKPGRHEYLFVVDGQWLPDPNAKESVANPFGGKNSVLIVSE
jgi:hypothetical protein